MKKQDPHYIRNKKNRQRELQNGTKERLKNLAELKIKNAEKYGTYPELIKIGEFDRIGGNAPQFIENEDMKKSYEYGYYVKGSRLLAGEFEKGTYSAEEQRNFGIRDLNNGVIDEYLLNLTDYSDYINGRIYQMGRNIYDYIIENNIQIEDYISLMSLFNENLKNPEFKNGYNDRENEIQEINQKRR